MSRPDPIAFERLSYRQGQQLRSADRRDQVAIEAQLSAWHNRAMHNVFGISEGMDVEFSPDSVTISIGLAYDARGRLLLLQRPYKLSYPASSSVEETAWLLLARYKPAKDFPRPGELDGVCFGHASTSAIESPSFLWMQEALWKLEEGVPLARITITDNVVKPDKDEFVPRRARARARAKVGSGETVPGHTSWELWTMPGVEGQRHPLGFQVRIDTSSAGFTQIPCYFAWLHSSRSVFEQPLTVAFEHVAANASIRHFVFRIFLPRLIGPVLNQGNQFVNQDFVKRVGLKQQLYVSWIGIEENYRRSKTHVHIGDST